MGARFQHLDPAKTDGDLLEVTHVADLGHGLTLFCARGVLLAERCIVHHPDSEIDDDPFDRNSHEYELMIGDDFDHVIVFISGVISKWQIGDACTIYIARHRDREAGILFENHTRNCTATPTDLDLLPFWGSMRAGLKRAIITSTGAAIGCGLVPVLIEGAQFLALPAALFGALIGLRAGFNGEARARQERAINLAIEHRNRKRATIHEGSELYRRFAA